MKRQILRILCAAAAASFALGILLQPAAALGRTSGTEPAEQADSVASGTNREWLPAFTAVEVSAPVEIRFVRVPDTEAPKIVYDTKGSYTTKFRAEVRDRVLRITERRDARRPERTTVTVCYNTLERISITDASATFEEGFTAPMLDLEVGGTAHVVADIDIRDLRMELTGRSMAELRGEARYLSLFVSTGKVEAAELESMSVMANVTGSGRASVWVTDRLEAKTSTGGAISYKGDPAILRLNEKFMGGNITRLETK